MSRSIKLLVSRKSLALIAIVALSVSSASSQRLDRLERERAQVMLQNVASDIRKYYYDPTLHGLDWDAMVTRTKEKIAKATSREEALLQIAALLELLGDSQTFFVPPQYPMPEDHGWQVQMVGTRCYVTHVRAKSDADNKGLKPGDEVLSINGFVPSREGLIKMTYVLFVLLHERGLRVELRDQSGKVRQVELMARVRQPRTMMDLGNITGRDTWTLRLENEDRLKMMRPRYKELGQELMVVKLPQFPITDLETRGLIDRTRKHSNLILDLRGNPGGVESSLQSFLGGMFEKDIKIADRVARENAKPIPATGSHNCFKGKLIVLVDSGTASAAELFARVIQIEKRGVVLGDRTAGSVMEVQYYSHQTGINPVYIYGTSVATADLVMADNQSVEHTGVAPDEIVLPTAEDLANSRDPVMARAAQMLGVKLTPEEAGQLFSFEWPRF